jgi:hypothetical protein
MRPILVKLFDNYLTQTAANAKENLMGYRYTRSRPIEYQGEIQEKKIRPQLLMDC